MEFFNMFRITHSINLNEIRKNFIKEVGKDIPIYHLEDKEEEIEDPKEKAYRRYKDGYSSFIDEHHNWHIYYSDNIERPYEIQLGKEVSDQLKQTFDDQKELNLLKQAAQNHQRKVNIFDFLKFVSDEKTRIEAELKEALDHEDFAKVIDSPSGKVLFKGPHQHGEGIDTLQEIIANSLDQTDASELTINIFLDKETGKVTISFQDNGSGFPESLLSQEIAPHPKESKFKQEGPYLGGAGMGIYEIYRNDYGAKVARSNAEPKGGAVVTITSPIKSIELKESPGFHSRSGIASKRKAVKLDSPSPHFFQQSKTKSTPKTKSESKSKSTKTTVIYVRPKDKKEENPQQEENPPPRKWWQCGS